MADSQSLEITEIGRLQQRLEQEKRAREEAELRSERGLRELMEKQRRMEFFQRIAIASNEAILMEETLQEALDVICEFIGWPVGHLFLLRSDQELLSSEIWYCELDDGLQTFYELTNSTHFTTEVGLPGRVLASGTFEWNNDFCDNDACPRREAAASAGLHSGFAFPLLLGSKVLAVMEFYTQDRVECDEALMELMMQIGTQLGRVIERNYAQEQIRHQFERLTALRAIDTAINVSMDLRLTLGLLLNQVISLLKVSAANILLCESDGALDYTAWRGKRGELLRQKRIELGFDYADQVMREQQIVYLPDLSAVDSNFAHAAIMVSEGFVCYCAVPLIAKGEVKGVLELFHSACLNPDGEWCEFLETLAGQAAIAVDNAGLFEGLQKSNRELVQAYDATIEGWSRALDLRDHETEGHTQRVTEMMVRFAHVWGLPEADLTHIRRGALLHDIGKMGVPDNILLKPGPLTPEERAVMSRHPQFAHDMLSPIAFLRPALEIPCAHHEKWDGTGYPYGLKGEEIPISARMFAVVDVWDALRFDRPYRKGWPEERVREHIRSLSGTHFDPSVVEVFLKILEADSPASSCLSLSA